MWIYQSVYRCLERLLKKMYKPHIHICPSVLDSNSPVCSFSLPQVGNMGVWDLQNQIRSVISFRPCREDTNFLLEYVSKIQVVSYSSTSKLSFCTCFFLAKVVSAHYIVLRICLVDLVTVFFCFAKFLD